MSILKEHVHTQTKHMPMDHQFVFSQTFLSQDEKANRKQRVGEGGTGRQ